MTAITILAAWDGQKAAAEIKRLLDAEGAHADVIIGMSVEVFDYAQIGGRLIVLWTQDGALQVSMYGPAEAACEHDSLVEVRIGPFAPPIRGRKVSPIDFTDWKGQRHGEWVKLRERLRAVDRRDAIPDEAKIAAVVMTAVGGMIAIPAAFDRVVDPAIGAPPAQSSAVLSIAEAAPQPMGLPAVIDNVGGPLEAEENLDDFTPGRTYRMSSMRYRAPPTIAALQSPDAMVTVDIQRRGLVGRIIAAASDLPLMPDEQTQSN
ncbi:MAG: hypothetical protein GC189_09000 [Alphaproteobacteria bacterium]|nr:hypothetical protein [Alphaproteobacteria bacterium]